MGRFASFNVAQHLWLGVLSLVATPILYHRLGEAAYGLLAVVNLVAAQLAILEFGFGHATIRRLAKSGGTRDPAELSRTLATSSWVFFGTAVVGSTVLLVGADVLAERYFQIPADFRDTGKTALRIGAVFFAVSMFGTLAGAVFQGIQRFGYLNLVSGVAATAQLLGSVVLVLTGFGVLSVLAWSVFLGCVTLAIHRWWLAHEAPGVRPFGRPTRAAFREMAGFGFLLMVAGVLTQVFMSGGALVLGHYVAVGMLPFFTVPFGLYQRLNQMGYGLASALYPLVAEMDGLRDGPSLTRVFVSGTRILLLVGTATMAPAVLVATPFLTVWMGSEFAAQGGVVLELLLAAFALSLATIPSIELARGTGRPGLLVGYTGVLAGVNLAGVALLAPTAGATGAGVAFLVAQGCGSVYLLATVGGRNCARVVSPGATAFVAVAAAAVFLALRADLSMPVQVGLAMALGVALVALGYFFGLARDERHTLRRMARRT